MEADDLRLMHEWLQRPHVRRWWTDRHTYEEVQQHYLPAIEGEKPTDMYIALLDEEAIGFVQTYLLADYPEDAALVGAREGDAGTDLSIGEESLTGKGLGTEIIRRFVEVIVFASPAKSCIADPDVRNIASIRAFEKAGFRVAKEFFDPKDEQTHALVRRDR